MRCLRPHFVVNILLPVGISFYTFTQIAFLVDAYRGNVARYALPHYALFVTYFPHLIAGPILHHQDMIPQFERAEAKRPDPHLILCGLIIFAIGLFKKTCLADGIQPLVALAFGPNAPTFDQAWIGALAYTFQLYFDFSGYSDMAIGISLMFGIFLPLNFNSPYKATSHHRFLAALAHDAVAVPARLSLHPARRQPPRPGAALRQSDDHHAARRALARRGLDVRGLGRAARRLSLHQSRLEQLRARTFRRALRPPADVAGLILTFLAVVVAWVFFRADNMATALYVLSKMADPTQYRLRPRRNRLCACSSSLYAALAWFAPNTQEIMGYDHKNRTVGEKLGAWRLRPLLLYASAAVLAFGILGIQQHSEFIYFRF